MYCISIHLGVMCVLYVYYLFYFAWLSILLPLLKAIIHQSETLKLVLVGLSRFQTWHDELTWIQLSPYCHMCPFHAMPVKKIHLPDSWVGRHQQCLTSRAQPDSQGKMSHFTKKKFNHTSNFTEHFHELFQALKWLNLIIYKCHRDNVHVRHIIRHQICH
jgi:hypothetical protein